MKAKCDSKLFCLLKEFWRIFCRFFLDILIEILVNCLILTEISVSWDSENIKKWVKRSRKCSKKGPKYLIMVLKILLSVPGPFGGSFPHGECTMSSAFCGSWSTTYTLFPPTSLGSYFSHPFYLSTPKLSGKSKMFYSAGCSIWWLVGTIQRATR